MLTDLTSDILTVYLSGWVVVASSGDDDSMFRHATPDTGSRADVAAGRDAD